MATIGSASLINMSVPSSDDAQNITPLQPKLQFRFRAQFINFGAVGSATSILTRQVKDITRPSVSWDEVTLPMYNSKVYVAGQHSWQDTTITLVDDATGEVSRMIDAQLQKQLDFKEQSALPAGADYKFMLRYEELDGGNGTKRPQILGGWEMYGCWIKTANYNSMAYGTNDAATISLTVRFDNALKLENGLSSVGPATGVGA